MTFSDLNPGAVFFFARDELPSAAGPCTTGDELLPLILASLHSARRSVPPDMEIRLFPSAQGALVVILPRGCGQNQGYLGTTLDLILQ